MCESLTGKLKDWYKEHRPTSQIQTLGITTFKKETSGSASSVNAKPAERRHLTPFGVKLAEEVNNMHNTENTLHVLM